MGKLHVVGVRHHSPACARFTAHVIARVRPAFVLVEGPVDMNARMGELLHIIDADPNLARAERDRCHFTVAPVSIAVGA